MGMLAQKEGPIDSVIARDYRKQWPTAISSSCFEADKLYLMKSNFYPGQFLYGLADPDAVGTKMRGVKRKLTLGKGESAGSSTSSSRRPRAATPAAAARVTIACPESEREEWEVTITCLEGKEKEQRPTIQVFVSGIVHRGAAAKQERFQPGEQ
jgi:hypothetical protein